MSSRKNLCPYCLADTRSRQGLHSHIMQTIPCRERMEAQASLAAGYNSSESESIPNNELPTFNSLLPEIDDSDFYMDADPPSPPPPQSP